MALLGGARQNRGFDIFVAFSDSYCLELSIILRKARIMCFFKNVELGVESIIYPCEHQCFCYSIQCLPSNPPSAILGQHFPLHDQYSFNLQQLHSQMTTDLATILHGINHNNAKIMGTLEVHIL